MCVYLMYEGAISSSEEDIDSLGVGVTSGCELPDAGAGNRTQDL